jgi:hypothetical protein
MSSLDDDAPPTVRAPFRLSEDGPRSSPRPELRRFFVDVEYVEPGYAARTQSKPKAYSFRFSVLAASREGAIEAARQQFDEAWRNSGVGWERRITSIRCERGA